MQPARPTAGQTESQRPTMQENNSDSDTIVVAAHNAPLLRAGRCAPASKRSPRVQPVLACAASRLQSASLGSTDGHRARQHASDDRVCCLFTARKVGADGDTADDFRQVRKRRD